MMNDCHTVEAVFFCVLPSTPEEKVSVKGIKSVAKGQRRMEDLVLDSFLHTCLELHNT